MIFQLFYKGFLKEEVKAKGRGDTKHHEALHSRSLLNIQKLLAVVTKVMKCEKPSHEYTKLKEDLGELAPEYKETWHRLLPFGNMFNISLLTGRRGREGLSEMKKKVLHISQFFRHKGKQVCKFFSIEKYNTHLI